MKKTLIATVIAGAISMTGCEALQQKGSADILPCKDITSEQEARRCASLASKPVKEGPFAIPGEKLEELNQPPKEPIIPPKREHRFSSPGNFPHEKDQNMSFEYPIDYYRSRNIKTSRYISFGEARISFECRRGRMYLTSIGGPIHFLHKNGKSALPEYWEEYTKHSYNSRKNDKYKSQYNSAWHDIKPGEYVVVSMGLDQFPDSPPFYRWKIRKTTNPLITLPGDEVVKVVNPFEVCMDALYK